VIQNFALMMTWVQNQPQFIPAAKAEFASVADGWLAAYAKARGYTVITHEVARPDARKRVPLPNVCDAFGVPYNDTFNMLRDFGSRFI
jgi:DNA polymerase III epsilon subunit-like protein